MPSPLPPVTAWSSACIAALIGFGGTVALIVQAARTLGATVPQTGSALTALCFAIAAAGALLSIRLRMPIVLAWSTPGAALLAGVAPGLSWRAAIGAFLCSAVLMVCVGLVPVLGRLAQRIPASVASAMLAGVLLPFCLGLFKAAGADPLLVAAILVVYLTARQRLPLYALLLVLLATAMICVLRGDVGMLPGGPVLGALEPVAPRFELPAMLGIGVPLFLVTLVSQNLPGLVVLKAAGYEARPGPLIVTTGVASFLAAPFGAHGINLAAITAAICTSADAHPDRARRWTVGVIYAACYAVLGLFAPALVRVFVGLPPAAIAALTGVALIPALLGALESALEDRGAREAAGLTFLAAGSGLTLYGLGAAFWGLVAGLAALAIQALLRRPAATQRAT